MSVIVSRTPLRISFVGGGTDLPSFYQEHGGAVISSAIDKYVTVEVEPTEFQEPNGPIILDTASHAVIQPGDPWYQKVYSPEQLEHPIVGEVLQMVGIEERVKIKIRSDLPARSGLGGSSALTVGLLHALTVYKREKDGHDLGDVPKEYLARKACEIEIDRLGKPIGKQDQYAAAFGGLRKYTFNRDGAVYQTHYDYSCEGLEQALMLFRTNLPRASDTSIFGEMDTKKLQQIKALVPAFVGALSYRDLTTIGNLLHQNWMLKRGLNDSISNLQLDGIYDLALEAGAIGGKLLGAGGGGHFLFVVPQGRQIDVKRRLEGPYPPTGVKHVPFRFESEGTRLA